MATEKELRNEIRKHVQKMLKEYQPGGFLQSVGTQARASLGSGRSMLDKYLGDVDTERLAKLPKMQKVSLLAALMKTFGITANDLTALRAQVSRQLKADTVPAAPTEATVEEGMINELEMSSTLASKGEKVEKTQAYQMLLKAIENKPASQQTAFVIDLISKLPLDDSAKRMIKMKIRSELK